MNNGISGVDEAVVIVSREAEVFAGEIAAKNPHASLKMLIENREVEMQLQCLPEAEFGLMRIAGTDENV